MSGKARHHGRQRSGIAATTPASPSRPTTIVPRWLFACTMLLWWFGGYGLVMYDVAVDRGPFSFLVRWQGALFGGSSLVASGLVAVVVIFFGPPWLLRRLRRLRPDSALIADLDAQMRLAMRSRGELRAQARTRWDAAGTDGRIRMARRVRNTALGMAVAGLVIASAISAWIRLVEDKDAGRPLTAVTLSASAPIAIGEASDYARIGNATPVLDAVYVRDYSIRHTAYRDYYTPLVPAGWQPGQRVYLLEQDGTVLHHGRDEDTSARADPPGPLEGELSFGGPREDVTAAFGQSGYAVGPWTAILRRDTSLNGRIPATPGFLTVMVWLEAGLFVVTGLIIAGLKQRQMRRLAESAST